MLLVPNNRDRNESCGGNETWRIASHSLLWLVRGVCVPPCPVLQTWVICSSAVAAGLFMGLGNSPFTHWNVVYMHFFIVICLSKPWCMVSVVFVTMSGFSLAHGVLCNVVFWAWKHDVMHKIWSRHFLLKYICIWEWALKIFWGKVGILFCFEMYSGINLGQVTNTLNLTESPEVKWYGRLTGNFWIYFTL